MGGVGRPRGVWEVALSWKMWRLPWASLEPPGRPREGILARRLHHGGPKPPADGPLACLQEASLPALHGTLMPAKCLRRAVSPTPRPQHPEHPHPSEPALTPEQPRRLGQPSPPLASGTEGRAATLKNTPSAPQLEWHDGDPVLSAHPGQCWAAGSPLARGFRHTPP